MKKAIICFPNVTSRETQYPTGLYKIGTSCKDEYDVIILDQRLEQDIIQKIENMINDNKEILCLGLSVMTGEQIKFALEISKVFHNRIKIAWGGIHPTILPEDTIKSEYIDYVLIGEGEESFLQLLRYLDGKSYRELFLDKNNHNYDYNFIEELNKFEYVDFVKYPIDKNYFVKRDGFKKAFTLETSRGCPHNCFFCHNSIFKKKYRSICAERVIEIIEYLYNTYEIDAIVFQEDNFFLEIERVKKIIAGLSRFSSLGWKANSRINYFEGLISDREFMKDLVDSRCKVLQFGIESGSERVIKLINKNINLDKVIEINKKMSEYPISLRYNFIIGFPDEEIYDIEKTFKLIERLQNDNPNVEPPFLNIYNPYPGTPLYKKACECGFKEPKGIEEWSKFNWNTVSFGWLSKEIADFIEHKSQEYFKNVKYLK